MAPRRVLGRALLGLAGFGLVLIGAVVGVNRVQLGALGGEDTANPGLRLAAADAPAPDAAQVLRGAYLARAGNCAACHTARGGPAYAGGRVINTPFGSVTGGNLTPDPETGLGRWTGLDFRRALRLGLAPDGRWLLPAFPFDAFSRVSDADADALWAFLRSQPPVRQATPPAALRWPYGTQAAQAVWRALFFRPAPFRPDPQQDAQWNRGAYLVTGLGHCGACHTPRNALGALRADQPGDAQFLNGASLSGSGWWAPSLRRADEAGLADWSVDEVVALLRVGFTPAPGVDRNLVGHRGAVMGPMAEVVARSTQHLSPEDARAMARFLRSLPPAEAAKGSHPAPLDAQVWARGELLYRQHCEECHGRRGQGVAQADSGGLPALAGNRLLTQPRPDNAIQAVLHGGYLPTTATNPRPAGMPPFAQLLSDADIAAVLSYARQIGGNTASAISERDVARAR